MRSAMSGSVSKLSDAAIMPLQLPAEFVGYGEEVFFTFCHGRVDLLSFVPDVYVPVRCRRGGAGCRDVCVPF